MSSIPKSELLERAHQLHEKIRGWRRTIHQNPELTFDEYKTAGLVNSTLIDLGIETETEVAKTGVVGKISGGAGPIVGLRADMDALPIIEENETAFNSQTDGVMHACGHDAHTAMLMGAATILKELADAGRLPGTVRLLFQPSEEAQDKEGKSGGLRMVEEGAVDGLDAVFGIHVASNRETGQVATKAGPHLAATDKFTIAINGSGGHAAAPHKSLDPIMLSSHVVSAIHHVVSRRVNPLDSGVITIGAIHGGTTHNVIPDTVTLEGTIRSYEPETRKMLEAELRKACSIVDALGGTCEVDIMHGYPTTVGDPEAAETAFAALNDLLGEENIHEAVPIMAGEDFSYMAQKVPGAFLNLGVRNPNWVQEYPVHTSTFRMDEDALPIGAAALAATAIEWMESHK